MLMPSFFFCRSDKVASEWDPTTRYPGGGIGKYSVCAFYMISCIEICSEGSRSASLPNFL